MKRMRGFDFKIQGAQAIGTLPDGSHFIVDSQRIPDIEQLTWHKNTDGYIGKIPRNIDGDLHITNEIRILKEDLNRAVEHEEYEKAADIRDKIKELEECNE